MHFFHAFFLSRSTSINKLARLKIGQVSHRNHRFVQFVNPLMAMLHKLNYKSLDCKVLTAFRVLFLRIGSSENFMFRIPSKAWTYRTLNTGQNIARPVNSQQNDERNIFPAEFGGTVGMFLRQSRRKLPVKCIVTFLLTNLQFILRTCSLQLLIRRLNGFCCNSRLWRNPRPRIESDVLISKVFGHVNRCKILGPWNFAHLRSIRITRLCTLDAYTVFDRKKTKCSIVALY